MQNSMSPHQSGVPEPGRTKVQLSCVCCSCPVVSLRVVDRPAYSRNHMMTHTKYRGHCAGCGAGRDNVRMKNTLNSHKQARPVPPHITHSLPYQSATNNRICTSCYLRLSKTAQ